jgi:hypothetical protein
LSGVESNRSFCPAFWSKKREITTMPRYYFTTDDGSGAERDDEGIEFPDSQAASDGAQNALADMAKEKLPNGARADFSVTVHDEAGESIYHASLEFSGQTAEQEREAEELRQRSLDEATALVATALKSGPH